MATFFQEYQKNSSNIQGDLDKLISLASNATKLNSTEDNIKAQKILEEARTHVSSILNPSSVEHKLF